MECLEELKKLNIEEVSKKTHVSILEIRAIINKDFRSFNHSKAIGFTKIFKRDYDIDLSEWLDEFVEETGAKEVQDEIFVISKEKSRADIKTKLIYLIIAIGAIAAISLIYTTLVSSKKPEKIIENKEIISEAKKVIEDAVEPPKEEVPEIKGFVPPQKEEDKLQPKIVEKKVEEVYIESNQDLWVGIKDNETQKTINKIFKGKYDLDPDKDYTITFGHGYFSLVYGDKRIDLKRRGPQKYRYREGKFEELQYVAPKPKVSPKPEPVLEGEIEPNVEDNLTNASEQN